MTKLISVVTPCYNEEASIQFCYERVRQIFSEHLPEYHYEHIFCDNSSLDKTVSILRHIASTDRNIKLILNARNFGPMRSNFHGVLQASGEAIFVFLPADLQDPPELMPEFVKKWEEGYQVVAGVRKQREEGFLWRSVRKLYYRTVTQFANIYIPPDVGDFQLIDKVVLEQLKQMDDYYPYMRGMIASCGFRVTTLDYTWKARVHGVSQNKLFHLVDQGLNGLISFTNIPLRMCMTLGFLLSGLSIAYALIQVFWNVIFYRIFSPPGIATLIVAVFFFSGVQLFFIGVLGEYIGAIHSQVRKRPLVIEKERVNF